MGGGDNVICVDGAKSDGDADSSEEVNTGSERTERTNSKERQFHRLDGLCTIPRLPKLKRR